MIKLIAFDWDDVLVLGARDGYFSCYHETLVTLGVTLDPEEEHRRILARWSQPYREELRELLKERPELLDTACKVYEGHYFGTTFAAALKPVIGVADLLQSLSREYLLSVATGNHERVIREQIMPRFEIPDVFQRIFSTFDIEDPALMKPSAFMLQELMKQVNASPHETLYVGDAKTDVLMAQAAGATPVVPLTGHLREKDARELGVKYIISDVTELPSVIRSISEAEPHGGGREKGVGDRSRLLLAT